MKWIKNMKIGSRLKVSFGILSALILLVGFSGILNISKINKLSKNMYEYDLIGVKDMTELKSNILSINMKMIQVMNSKDKAKADSLQKEIDAIKNNDDILIEEYNHAIISKESSKKLEQFKTLLKDYRDGRKEILDLFNSREYDKAANHYYKLENTENQIVSFLDDYVKFNVNRAKIDYDNSNSIFKTTIYLSGFLMIVVLGFAIFLSVGTASFITTRIEKLLKFAEELGRGDLGNSINIDSKEELGALASALNDAATARKEYELDLSMNFEELEASYEEITALEEELREKYDQLTISEEKLKYSVFHDFLTDLPNRQWLYEKFESDFVNTNMNGALLFLDLDNFKYINDTVGHEFGDKLIQAVGERLKLLVNEDVFLVRIGGDEFIILIKNIMDEDKLESFGKSVLLILNDPFEINENSMKITSSIGIAKYPEHGENVDELLKRADIAMYYSKRFRKNRYTIFINSMVTELVDRMQIVKNLRTALLQDEFLLYYQPQIDTSTKKLTSFEALIRWNNPELGFVSPEEFISIAEENEMIVDIGNWVMFSACKFAKAIQNESLENCYISVNVSVLQFLQTDFVETVFSILAKTGLEAKYLEIEITETVYIENYEMICKKLVELRENGIRIALDDFGKGYSSLSYLRRLPIDTLKLDKSFIDDMCNETEKSLVENIIKMGQKMELNIIAEGVETQEQYLNLKTFGCDKIQGYYFSKPLTEENAKNFIHKNRSI